MPRKCTMIPRVCEQCGRDFSVYPYRIQQDTVRFCSRACHHAHQKSHAQSTDAAFWTNTQDVEGCWVWTGHKNERGYGLVWHEGAERRAHRIAYQKAKGHIPEGLFICHTCDNPSCVNPDHLFLGTPMDNVQDSISKGRFSFGKGKRAGEQHPCVKLTEQDVREIRALYADGVSQSEIMQRYGISQTHVSQIINRRNWKHI